jgi:hypothetical protein
MSYYLPIFQPYGLANPNQHLLRAWLSQIRTIIFGVFTVMPLSRYAFTPFFTTFVA